MARRVVFRVRDEIVIAATVGSKNVGAWEAVAVSAKLADGDGDRVIGRQLAEPLAGEEELPYGPFRPYGGEWAVGQHD